MRVPPVGVRVEHRVSQRNAPTHAVEEYSSEKTTRRKRAECLKAIGVGNQNSHGKWQGCRVLLELKFLVGSDEEIKRCSRQLKQFSVSQAGPSGFGASDHLACREHRPKAPRE
jgi:hypothetical protein